MNTQNGFIKGLMVIASTVALFASAKGSPLYSSAEVYYEFDTLGSGGEIVDSNSNDVDLVALGGTASLIAGVNGNGINLYDPANANPVVLTTTGTGSNDSVLNVTRDTPFTIASWVKLTNISDRFFIASKVLRNEPGSDTGLELKGWSLASNAGGILEAIWRLDSTPPSGTGTVNENRILVQSTTGITDTNWHHVALTFDYDELDATRGMRMYIDGALVGMTATSPGLAGAANIDLSHTSPFVLSGRYDTQLNEGGSLDDLAIWKTALSAQDILSLLIPEPSSVSLFVLSVMSLLCHRHVK